MCEIWPINLTVMHFSFTSSTLCSLFALCFHGSGVPKSLAFSIIPSSMCIKVEYTLFLGKKREKKRKTQRPSFFCF